MGVVFLGFTPEHWCLNPGVKQVQMHCGWSIEKALRVTVPFEKTSAGVLHSQRCERFDQEWNITDLSCDDLDGEITEAKHAALPTSACNSWDYEYEGRESFVTEV